MSYRLEIILSSVQLTIRKLPCCISDESRHCAALAGFYHLINKLKEIEDCIDSVYWSKFGVIPASRWTVFNCEYMCVCVCFLCRSAIDDTAQYTAVAVNTHGQASSQAAVIVKSEYLLKHAIRITHSQRSRSNQSESPQLLYLHWTCKTTTILFKGLRKVLRIYVQLQKSIQKLNKTFIQKIIQKDEAVRKITGLIGSWQGLFGKHIHKAGANRSP